MSSPTTRVDDVHVAVAVDVEHGDAVRLVAGEHDLRVGERAVAVAAHDPHAAAVGGGDGDVHLAVVVEVARLVGARLDADRHRREEGLLVESRAVAAGS